MRTQLNYIKCAAESKYTQ